MARNPNFTRIDNIAGERIGSVVALEDGTFKATSYDAGIQTFSNRIDATMFVEINDRSDATSTSMADDYRAEARVARMLG